MRATIRRLSKRQVAGIAVSIMGPAMLTPPTLHAAALQPSVDQPVRPNIVFILADDLDYSLVKTMPNVRRLERHGVTFHNSFVVDSLCCPSRAATFTGMYPHNTGVRTNTSSANDPHPSGGYPAFRPIENRSFSVTLHNAGYRTAFMGKFMNEYPVVDGSPVPPGWDKWNPVSSGGYQGWHYAMGRAGQGADGQPVVKTMRHDGLRDRDYVQTVLRRRAAAFISAAQRRVQPYFLEVAPYAPHARIRRGAHLRDPKYPPALKDRPSRRDADGNCGGNSQTDCLALAAPKLRGFNQTTRDNRAFYADGHHRLGWLPARPIGAFETRALTRNYRDRARMAQSVDRMVGEVMAATRNEPTYIVFTSDNGYRLGQFRLSRGKGTAYTPDIKVPLVIGGSALPARAAGRVRDQVVENIDLAPTFEAVAGVASPDYRDGVSLLPLMNGATAAPLWRQFAFIEHRRPPPSAGDPDHEKSTGRIPTYWAVRSRGALFVQERLLTPQGNWRNLYEYYTGLSRRGAYENTNVYRPGNPRMEEMRRALADYRTCSGATCRTVSVR
jgi:arylsulfatase A-like enzyme